MTAPPTPSLVATLEGEEVQVRVDGVRVPFSTRWESEGEIEGDGETIAWRPQGGDDFLRVAVRTRGGVAGVTLRADSIEG